MSAVSVFRGPSAAFLLTDALGTDKSGTIHEIRSKAIASNRLKIAVGMCGERCITYTEDGGRYSPGNDVAKLLGEAASRAEFLSELPGVMRACYAVTAELDPPPSFQFAIALWNDEHDRPEAYVIGSPGHTFPGGLPPFTLAGVNPSVSPPVDPALWPAGDLTRREALAIIRAQRDYRDNGAYRVGGFAELTTVDAKGAWTETICRWADRVGSAVEREVA